ncbi:MAG TPA: L-threonylcarbamoyladenylate synthase, partial [Candidatus Binatia bacterium]|nr:L-threonylcarbamoyladenylate synthase [Candidatus Binatia bacterium]
LAAAFWPGGLTLVVRRRTDVPLPLALTGGALAPGAIPTVGLRVPDHEAPRALAAALGPLPTTSANRSGEPEARDADEIERLLGDAIDLVLDGGPARGGPASTVVDVSGSEAAVLRAGAIPAARIEEVLATLGPGARHG